MPRVLSFILSSGAILTLVFTRFVGRQNLRAQSPMTGILAFLIASRLLVITAIDYPVAGDGGGEDAGRFPGGEGVTSR